MLFGRSGAGVLVQQYLNKYGAYVIRAWLMSTGAPDLAARDGQPYSRSLEDFNPAAARLFNAALDHSHVDRRYLTWMLQRIGYLPADGRQRQVELLEQLKNGKRTLYWRYLLKFPFNYGFMASAMRFMPENDLPKVRIFELCGWDLVKPQSKRGDITNLVSEAFGEVLADFSAAAHAGQIPGQMPAPDRAPFRGEVLVLSGSRDIVFSPAIGKKIAHSYPNSRWILVNDGHRMDEHRTFCSTLARTFFGEGLRSPAMKLLAETARREETDAIQVQ